MSTIRRVLSGISSSISRTRLETELPPVSPLAPREPLDPVAPVRRGFSDESDFQAELEDLDASLAAHAPHLEGMSGPASAPAAEQLRVFSGESSFESGASRSRYAQMLGSQLPSSLGAPQERSGGLSPAAGGRGQGVGAADMDALLSPDAAAWELQHLDTSATSAVEPEDLLFMLDGPGAAAHPVLELSADDIAAASTEHTHDVAPLDAVTVDALDEAAYLTHEELDAAVRPAGPDEFLADTNDLGSLIPEEPSVGDAALAGVVAPLAANPAAASTPVMGALASQAVEAVADTFEVEPAASHEAAVQTQPAATPES